ncbi:MAG: SRPBCC family protein, partial [Candidatus Binatia bacterium]
MIAALALATAIARAEEPALSADELRRLAAREILTRSEDVPGHKIPRMHAAGVIQAPPEKVWAIIQDCNRYEETMPRTLESDELERDGNRVHCKAKIDMPFPFADLVSETNAVHTIEPGVRWRRQWTHRGGDFDANEGSWTLEPRDGGAATLARYQALFEPKVSLPNWVLSWAQNVTLPKLIEGLREHAE